MKKHRQPKLINLLLLALLLGLVAAMAVRCSQSAPPWQGHGQAVPSQNGDRPSPTTPTGATPAEQVGAQEDGPQPLLPIITIRVGDAPVRVEVADEPEQRRLGYMNRPRPPETGMLFIWPRPERQGFWMKNCDWDIDLAYIADDGLIFQVERMVAHDQQPVRSRRPAQYVLEMPAGRFAELGIAVGQKMTFPDDTAED
jgi:uncharacterized membrane protein (UPF0127 family)